MDYQNEPTEPEVSEEHEEYGFMERELIFKLLASHAMVDAAFYEQLKRGPGFAAGELHIQLNDEDIDYITNKVDWDTIDKYAEEIRQALNLKLVTNSW